MLQDKTVIPNLYLSFKKVIQDPSGPPSEEQLLIYSHTVIKACILSSTLKVKLMNQILSFALL